jgi:rRNA-processing protein FCF1
MDNEIMRAKKGKRRGKKRVATKCREIRRRMGKAGIRTIRICPGKPARIVG